METHASRLSQDCLQDCLTGDFNFHINWHQWSTPFSSRSKEELFLETLRNSFLYQHVIEPTRRRGTNEPSTLDLVLTSEENQVSDLTYHAPLGKSDHSVLSFNFNSYLNIKLTTKRFLYDKANYGAMKIAMDKDNWLQIFIRDADQLDVNDCWAMLKTKLHHLRNQYVPQSKVGEPSWRGKGRVPISKQLRQLIKEKKRLHRRWMKSINNGNEETDRQNYTRVRNNVNKLMTRTKREYERTICNQTKENPKRFWKHIRDNMKTKTGVYPLLESTTDETSLKTEDKEKAEILQRQFCRVFTKEPEGELPAFPSRTNKEVKINLNIEMVRKEILSINTNKAIGPDEIHPRILKELVEYISIPLFIIMQKSLSSGVLPCDWKLADVSPIFEKGAKNLAENYRPISLTSIACRILEKIIKNNIMDHLTREKNMVSSMEGLQSPSY